MSWSASALFAGSRPAGRSTAFSPWWNLTVNRVAAVTSLPPKARVGLYRAAGVDCRTFNVAPGLWLYSAELTVESGAFIGWRCRIHNRERVTIERGAFIGPEVNIITTGHDIGPADQRAGELKDAAVTIGRGAWIGAGATVLPGVSIGPGVVVAAGAVVVSDCDADGLYAGVPARRKRDLPAGESPS